MLLVLIGLVILGGVTSQSVMDASTTLLLLFLIYDLFKKKLLLKNIKPLGIEWAFVGYFAVAVIGLIFNGKPPVPWFFYLSKFNWVLNLYILAYTFNKIDFDYSKWLKYFCIAFILPNLYALITYFVRYDYLTHKVIQKGTLGVVNSATYHAHGNSLIFVFFVSLFVFYFKHLSNKLKILCGFSFTLMAASVFFSFTRGIWFASFASLFCLFLIQNKKYAAYFTLSSLGAFALLSSLSELVRNRVLQLFTTNSDYIRLDLIKVHLLMFKEHPWFGIGYWESYRQIADYWPLMGLPQDYFESHAHNQIVSVLANTGLIGAFFFAAIVVYFFKQAWSFYRESKNSNSPFYGLSVACLITLIHFFLACLTDVTFEYAKIRGLLIVTLAALISFKNRKPSANEVV